MTCSPFDLKDYFFGELDKRQRALVDEHLGTCGACREELDALSATRSAVMCMREEEPPRRIAFVSDKVFEPRWWQKLFASGPRLGFVSAAMLAGAIVIHALQAPAVIQPPAAPTVAQVDQKMLEAEVTKRVQAAVDAAYAQGELRQTERLLQVVNARIAQSDREHRMTLRTIAHYLETMEKRNSNVRKAYFEPAGVTQ